MKLRLRAIPVMAAAPLLLTGLGARVYPALSSWALDLKQSAS